MKWDIAHFPAEAELVCSQRESGVTIKFTCRWTPTGEQYIKVVLSTHNRIPLADPVEIRFPYEPNIRSRLSQIKREWPAWLATQPAWEAMMMERLL
jgi:hypothetical protein